MQATTTQTILPSDARLTWSGALSLETGDGWAKPWRIPHQQRALFYPALVERAAMPAGVRITLRLIERIGRENVNALILSK